MGRLRTDEFDRFVAARWSALHHLARLLTGGDRHRAEDLLQEALVKLWFAWPRVAEQAPEAYVRRVLVRAAARSARRRWWGEQPVAEMPDPPGVGDESAVVDERTRLEAVLALLPARQRAAVVLRYYQDLPEQQVARLLGCPVGTARSLTSRGVARLRQLMAEPVEPLDSVESVAPVEPAKSVEPVESVEPVAPVE
ncbi:SigE family RNA polymerase sigma factor [Streptomyces sp. SAI-041]|jgi:RNA polymerase sigma-70 factor (sigma-E family)|uniref:SigE family RNA polymerase sigma factor n=1 Tax=Streptomyces sp. SAI-041 TaxID=2940548 RepID=UPI002473CD5E|nr:SigE family RNA polymerase sigma factor [Streptomyces sp. SAI-041]MDH6546539.1 RNA polymerase sigma-70 factor (sigma-E family) [Streptomyces sp. SAI-041]